MLYFRRSANYKKDNGNFVKLETIGAGESFVSHFYIVKTSRERFSKLYENNYNLDDLSEKHEFKKAGKFNITLKRLACPDLNHYIGTRGLSRTFLYILLDY